MERKCQVTHFSVRNTSFTYTNRVEHPNINQALLCCGHCGVSGLHIISKIPFSENF